MQIKTILNRIQEHRGFAYGTVQLDERPSGLNATDQERVVQELRECLIENRRPRLFV